MTLQKEPPHFGLLRSLADHKKRWSAPRKLSATVWAAITVFAVYRLATFIPQPLDGHHTLRPILNAWFDAYLRHYDHPETAYEDWPAFCILALLVVPAL